MVLDSVLTRVVGECFKEEHDRVIAHVDKRTKDYRDLILKVVHTYNLDDPEIEEASDLLKNGLRTLFFYDFYHETGDRRYLASAWNSEENLYKRLSPEHKLDIVQIREDIMPFFYVERKIWDEVRSKKQISDEEFGEFWWRKASDALFYASLMTPFTSGKDYGKPFHVYTQLLDGILDIKEYEKDLKEELPNLLVIRIIQNKGTIPKTSSEALHQLIEIHHDRHIINIAKRRVSELSDFDFTNCQFLYDGIKQKQRDLESYF